MIPNKFYETKEEHGGVITVSSILAETCDEPRYCNNNATTPRATNFTYQPRVHTNLEVIVLYAQVEVKVLLVVTICLARDPGVPSQTSIGSEEA